MPDDWSWFWAGESGRANLLRDELEGLQATAAASSARSARLSSQLHTLQGSIESRLQALSAAFDAYVELGDVREQLDGYPDTSAVRRDALRALTVLQQGGAAEPVAARGLDYWLVDAVNEVAALAAGTGPAPGTDRGARSQEHETFVVAALGWLGHGERAIARVPSLLVGDGALAAPQVVLWRAAVHGVFGDVLDAVHASWRPDLDVAAPAWDAFTRGVVRTGDPVDTLRFVKDLLDGAWAPPSSGEAPAADDRAALRGLVDVLVGAGLGDERALLERARVLRARIEQPGGAEPTGQTEPPRTPTTALVRSALLDPDVAPATRAALVAWVRPGLQAQAAAVAAAVAARQPTPTLVRTESGDVEVGTDGPDPGRLAQLDAVAAERWSTPQRRLVVPGAAAALTLVVGLVLLATRLGGLGVFLLVVAAALAGVTVRALVRARSTRAELAGVRERTRQRVEQGRVQATATRAALLETKAEVATLARAVAGSGATPAGLR